MDHSRSLDSPALWRLAASAVPVRGSRNRSLAATDLLGRVVAADELDKQRFKRPT